MDSEYRNTESADSQAGYPDGPCQNSYHKLAGEPPVSYAPFYEEFPDIADKETRMLTVLNIPGLPPGRYYFIEAYCDEPGCDCRRVFFNVVDEKTRVQAVIAYGWESREFYVKWFGEDDPTVIRELQGPILNLASPQSPLAPMLLKQMDLVLRDRNYVERLKRHYTMYKAAINRKARRPSGTQTQASYTRPERKHKKRK
jgi:hypothetical protein